MTESIGFEELEEQGITLWQFIQSHPILRDLADKYGWRAWSEPEVTYGSSAGGGSFDTDRVGGCFIHKKVGKITFYFG